VTALGAVLVFAPHLAVTQRPRCSCNAAICPHGRNPMPPSNKHPLRLNSDEISNLAPRATDKTDRRRIACKIANP